MFFSISVKVELTIIDPNVTEKVIDIVTQPEYPQLLTALIAANESLPEIQVYYTSEPEIVRSIFFVHFLFFFIDLVKINFSFATVNNILV